MWYQVHIFQFTGKRSLIKRQQSVNNVRTPAVKIRTGNEKQYNFYAPLVTRKENFSVDQVETITDIK